MNWDDLRFFLAVYRHGSLSATAKALGVQHSTVARRLQNLEEALGCRLFDRVGTKHMATAAGREVEVAARDMEQNVLQLDRRLVGRDADLQGPLLVSTADAMAVTFLMPIFARFAERYPEIDLRVSATNAYVNLNQREADVVIRASNDPEQDLHGRREAQLAFAVYGSRRYLEDLKTQTPRWVAPEGGLPHQSWIRAQMQEASVAITVDEAILTHAAIRQHLGVGLLPCFMGDTDADLGRYRDPVPDTTLDLWILLHPDLKHTAKVRAFVDFVREALGAHRDLLEGRGVEPRST